MLITICTLGCPKKYKFRDSGQTMGEIIIKWFYYYYFRFRQLFVRAMLKNQNQIIHCAHSHISFFGAQSIRNAAENYKNKIRWIFGWVKIWKIMKNHKKMLCYKISENPLKVFLQLLARGMNKIKKKIRIYFRTLRHSSFLLPPVMECITEKGAFWDTLMYI